MKHFFWSTEHHEKNYQDTQNAIDLRKFGTLTFNHSSFCFALFKEKRKWERLNEEKRLVKERGGKGEEEKIS